MWHATKWAIWWCSGRGKASVLWLMVGYVYFKRRGLPLLWSSCGFRRKVLAVHPAFLTSSDSCIFPKCRMTHDLMMPVWNPDILTLLHPVFRFFKELEERHQQSIVIDDISDIVCKHAQSNFDPYVTYCSNEVYQQRTLQRLVWVAEQTHTNSYHIPPGFDPSTLNQPCAFR